MSKITLYDLPSKGHCACWSLNPWKARLALNFKGLDYQTEWVEYPDIEPRLSPHVPANPPNGSPSYARYSMPAAQFPDGTYVMDSKAIVQRLEKDYPSPPLHLDSPLVAKVETLLPKAHLPLSPNWMPLVPLNLLNPRSEEYFERTRKKRVGMPLSDFAKEKGGEAAWEAAKPGLRDLAGLVEESGGPFVMGSTPSFADFIIVGFLHMLKRIDEKIHQRAIEVEPAFGKLYNASQQWIARDD